MQNFPPYKPVRSLLEQACLDVGLDPKRYLIPEPTIRSMEFASVECVLDYNPEMMMNREAVFGVTQDGQRVMLSSRLVPVGISPGAVNVVAPDDIDLDPSQWRTLP
jgi:hypothetical protein